MRKEKFNSNKSAYENDDIKYAFDCNDLSEKLGMVDVIVAEICGENDGANWYWVLQMRDGSFAWAKGGCDYTGWDCQSSAEIHEGFISPESAIDDIEIESYDDRKNIKNCLLKQITEELPFAIYTEKKEIMLKLISKINCPRCEEIKKYLEGRGIEFEVEMAEDLGYGHWRDYISSTTGKLGFPFLRFDGKIDTEYVNGSTEEIIEKINEWYPSKPIVLNAETVDKGIEKLGNEGYFWGK